MTDTKVERKQIREVREELGLAQFEVAELAGCSSSTVHALEKGYRSLTSTAAQCVLEVLGVEAKDVAQENELEVCLDRADWSEDGFALSTPRRMLREWREVRNLTQVELAVLAQMNSAAIQSIEQKRVSRVRAPTKHRLCKALRIHPDKLALPGEKEVSKVEIERGDFLRAEVRAKARLLRRWQDVVLDGRYLTHRAYDDLDGLIKDTAQELEGT